MNGEGIELYTHLLRENKASEKIASVFYDLRTKGYSGSKPFSVGTSGKDVIAYSQKNKIALGTYDIYFSVKAITHAMRPTKGQKRVSDQDLIDFPVKKNSMDVYYDGESFVYTDYKKKFIVRPNYTLKLPSGKTKVANFITAGLVTDATEFTLSKYDKVRVK